jgi:hypothetical protein
MTNRAPIAALTTMLAATPAWAQSATVQPAKFATPPIVDGRLDDEVWVGATRISDFRQVQPADNAEPSATTELRVGYDKRALYLAFRATDTSGRIRATVARRDAIADDDSVGVYLDTFRDRRRAYYIFFNPLGIQADGIYLEGKTDPDLTVDLVMDSRGIVDATGYTVEVAIPFASLRHHSGAGRAWGLHVQRFIRRDRNEQISWMPLSRELTSLLDQAGQLGEFIDVGEGRPLEIIPTGVATQTGSRTASGMVNEDQGDPGLTVNLGVTPTVNAAFTVNPDFAQVEADQLLLTVNQRFPIFYDEKRPFFLEGIDAFQTPIQIAHTRTIVDPGYAAKVSGKHGRTTVGALYAEDGGAKIVARIKRDVGQDSTLGGSVTGLFDGPRYSHLASADARVRLNGQTFFTAQLATTVAHMAFRDTVAGGRRERDGQGLAYFAKVERRTRHTVTAVTSTGFSPDYRADLGFTRLVNTNNVTVQTTYNPEPRKDARLISWSLTHVGLAQWDWQGRANFVYTYPQARFNFRRQTFLQAVAFRDYERIFESEFGIARGPGRQGAFAGDSERSTSWEGFVVAAGSAPTEALSFSATLSRSWDVFDYDFGAGPKFPRVSPAALGDSRAPLDPGAAASAAIGASLTWRPVDALRTSVDVSRNTLRRNDTGLVAYDVKLVSWRTTYQFTRFAFVRLRTDWNSSTATLTGQYLAAWTPNPGTAIYAGYNDTATIDGHDPVTRDAVPGFRRHGRTAFVKVSYLFRLSI